MLLPRFASDAAKWLQQAPDSLRQRADSAAYDSAAYDSVAYDSVAYDSVWSASEAAPYGLERIMVIDGKIYVVVGVLLLIWFGLLFYLYRTDRKLDQLERRVADDGTLDSDTSP